ncbi:MAG TPA: glycosyltransferase family 2 protein [Bacilli bacterium]
MAAWAMACGLLLFWAVVCTVSFFGWRNVRTLPNAAEAKERLPLVSVIVAAKEEAENIAATVRSLMGQKLARMELIVVNDRSRDATGVRAELLKKEFALREKPPFPLKTVHITALPEGWLGKNYALYQGYLQARGSMLLFADADVRFDRDVVKDALAYMSAQQIDHLTLIPDLQAEGFWLKAFVRYFLFSLSLVRPPWLANMDKQKKYGFGVGAFNLMKRSVYEAIGTHKAIAMRPDDDLELGMRIKQGGYRQRVMTGTGRLEVKWYNSLAEAFQGLEKNLFAGFRYNPLLAFIAVSMQLMLGVLPFAGLFSPDLPLAIVSLAAVVLFAGAYLFAAGRISQDKPWDVLVLPVSALLVAYAIARSACLAVLRGGIYWRGTFYPLRELRRKF